MNASDILKKHEDANEMHFHEVDRKWIIQAMKEYAALSQRHVTGSSIPNPPEFPLNRVLREGVGHFCTNCGSTVSKDGFLGLFGEMLCHNEKCPNSKSKKNYR